MKGFTDLIKKNFPNYKELAKEAFDRDYDHQWERPMYQDNTTFKELKNKYGNKHLTRQLIIDLFKDKKYYEGFLCAMVWGNIGTYQNGRQRFESVFNKNNEKEISDKIDSVIKLLNEGDIENSYLSLFDKNPEKGNAINGVGEAFFTKLLYFSGASIEKLNIKPLIYDNNIRIFYYNLLNKLNESRPRGAFNRYIDYCTKMDIAKEMLELPNSGYVEALLFRKDIRAFIHS